MDKELKDKWTAALRSGVYEQGHEKLNSNGKLCCLGVLCEVLGAKKIEHADGVVSYNLLGGETSITVLSSYQARVLGISVRNITKLWHMNDGIDSKPFETKSKTFAEIADWIEEHDLAETARSE